MAGRLAAELKQNKAWTLIEEEAFLNLVRTSERLQLQLSELLKPFQLSRTQYNILRILRGAGEAGITCSQASERMVTHDPDITRLLDRLEKRGLIQRERSSGDRRVVLSQITSSGLELVNSIDSPIAEFMKQRFQRLSPEKIRDLIEMLETLRSED
jgi:DNA-binding MarR family transcriptional regulator